MTLERNNKLISKRFYMYLIPSVLMIFAMQFGSLLDGILVGNMINNEALSATSLIMPILYIIQIPGFALGVGGSIVIANLLGKRDVAGAKKVFSISLILGTAISLVFAIVGIFVSRPLANMFSNDPYIQEAAYQYVFIYLITDPIISLALLFGNFMAVDNNPKLSGAFFIISNVAKIGLEILFIHLWGMYGAALSTAAGYLIGFITLFGYVKSKRRLLNLTFNLKDSKLKEVLKASSTTIINLALTAVQMLIVNMVIGQIITDKTDIVAFGLVANMVFIFDLFCGGIINVIPNICGILYGEKDLYALKSIAKKIYLINLGVTIVIAIIICAFPYFYSMLFGFNVSDPNGYIALILRVYLISFIGYEISKFGMNYYPAVDKNLPSLITVFLREAVIVLPVTLVLLYQMGILGYCIACAVTETSTVIITYIFIFFYEKKRPQYHGLFMLEKYQYESIDVTITNELNNASSVSEALTNFALEHNIHDREAQIVGLASEEIVNNIVTYGYKRVRQSYIDISLKIMEDKMVLRVRDDGLPFDPTKYHEEEEKEYSTSGIRLIEKLTDKMSYMRLLNLNNTVFEINI